MSLLQFCNLTNLEELRLVSTRLKGLPYSLGCLNKLRTLDVSKNDLRGLPDTIMHCRELRSIDISGNQMFKGFPGWVMELPHLTSYKTTGTQNNTITWTGGDTNVFLSRSAVHESRVLSSATTGDPEVAASPSSLEQLAAGAVGRSAVNMEHLYRLPANLLPLVEGFMMEKKLYICAECKKLLLGEGTHTVCVHTGPANAPSNRLLALSSLLPPPPDGVSTIYVLAYSFKGMRNFSMELRACPGGCDQAVETRLREWQRETRKEVDREYDEMVRKANEEFGMDTYYAKRIAHYAKCAIQQERRGFRQRRQRCICM